MQNGSMHIPAAVHMSTIGCSRLTQLGLLSRQSSTQGIYIYITQISPRLSNCNAQQYAQAKDILHIYSSVVASFSSVQRGYPIYSKGQISTLQLHTGLPFHLPCITCLTWTPQDTVSPSLVGSHLGEHMCRWSLIHSSYGAG
jgi:hypothetical protein